MQNVGVIDLIRIILSLDAPIIVEDATFSWGCVDTDNEGVKTETYPSTLKNINMRVKSNSLVAIVGTVGAGKSSIISALLGEMDKLSGRVNTYGTIAYVSQQAWIQNASLQDNILFGSPLNRKRYNQVVAACALKPDIEMLPGMERNRRSLCKCKRSHQFANMYTFQVVTQLKSVKRASIYLEDKSNVILEMFYKQMNFELLNRFISFYLLHTAGISLARAVYSNADIFLLDDPLSAVDSHVGKHIFDNVIGPNGLLANKTRVLVTHGITYLPDVDEILVIKDNAISEKGNLNELLARHGDFAEFLVEHLQQEVNEHDHAGLNDIKIQLESTLDENTKPELREKFVRAISYERSRSHSASSRESMVRNRSFVQQKSQTSLHEMEEEFSDEKLIEQETSEIGGVKFAVYKHYLKSVGVGLMSLAIGLTIAHQVFSVGSNAWLTKWSTDKDAANDTSLRNMYLGVYAAFGLGQGSVYLRI